MKKKKIFILFLFAFLVLIFLSFFISKERNESFYELKKENLYSSNPEDIKYYSILDDYYLLNKYQYDIGVCWSFAATRSAETMFAKRLNEYVSFSEASPALTTRGLVGDGSLFTGHYYASDPDENNFGITFENDFPYEKLYFVNGMKRENSGNIEISDSFLRNDKFDNFYYDITFDEIKTNDSQKILKIKTHLLKYSAVFLEIDRYKFTKNKVYNDKNYIIEKTNSGIGSHAVAIIGYDDDYQIESGEKGAFIVMNSNSYHSGDSIFYAPYSFVIQNRFNLQGYKFKTDNLIKSERNVEYLDNPLNGIYKSSNNFQSQPGKLKNNNIFTKNQLVNLTYTFPAGASNFKMEILDNGKKINDLFNIKYQNSKVSVVQKEFNTLASSAYNVRFTYNLNGKTRKEFRQIHIINYSELLFTSSVVGDVFSHITFQNIDERRPLVVYNEYDNGDYGTLNLRATAYTKIKEYYLKDNVKKTFLKNNGNEIKIKFDNKTEGIYEDKITFIMEDGSEVFRNIKKIYLKNQKNTTFVNISLYRDDYNYQNFPELLKPVVLDNNSEFNQIKLEKITKNGYNLEALELYNHKNKKIGELTKDSNDNYIFNFKAKVENLNKFKTDSNANNYATKNYDPLKLKNYSYTIFVKPRFIKDISNDPDFNDLEISISGKNKFNALEEVFLQSFFATASYNGNSIPITLKKLVLNQNKVSINDSFLKFIIEYNGIEYEYHHPISVSKNKISIPSISNNEFIYDQTLKSLEIPNSPFYLISGNGKIEVGNYEVIIEIIDKDNYIFEDNTQIHKYLLKIIPPLKDNKIKNIKLSYDQKNDNKYFALFSFDLTKFNISASFNDEIVSPKIMSINYQNNSDKIIFGDTYIILNLRYEDVFTSYKYQIEVSKIVIKFNIKSFKLDYKGSNLTFINENKELVNISNNIQKDKGKYNVIINLKDNINYVLENGKDTITYQFEIVEKDNELINKDEKNISKIKNRKLLFGLLSGGLILLFSGIAFIIVFVLKRKKIKNNNH